MQVTGNIIIVVDLHSTVMSEMQRRSVIFSNVSHIVSMSNWLSQCVTLDELQLIFGAVEMIIIDICIVSDVWKLGVAYCVNVLLCFYCFLMYALLYSVAAVQYFTFISLMHGFWNSSYPENLEVFLEQETTAF